MARKSKTHLTYSVTLELPKNITVEAFTTLIEFVLAGNNNITDDPTSVLVRLTKKETTYGN